MWLKKRSENQPTGREPGACQRGIALVSVLWFLMLLTLIATTLSLTSRSGARQAANLVGAAQARYLAEAGIQLGLMNLSVAPADQPWLADGSPYRLSIGDGVVTVALFDERGKIDLNGAPAELLDGLLSAAEVADDQRARLVDAILDWRDEDDLRRLNGAEDADYAAAGLDYGAKDAPFDTVEELQRVLGMTAKIYQAIYPAVTVNSGLRGINPLVAPKLALMALPGVTADWAEHYIEQRRTAHQQGLEPPEPPTVPPQYLAPASPGVNYTVYTEAEVGPVVRGRFSVVVRRNRVRPLIISMRQEAQSLLGNTGSQQGGNP